MLAIIGAVAGALAGLAGAYVAFTRWRDRRADIDKGRDEAIIERLQTEAERGKQSTAEMGKVQALPIDDLEAELNHDVAAAVSGGVPKHKNDRH